MSDVRLFKINKGKAKEISKRQAKLEKNIQTLVENNLEEFFGVRFLETEYTTGKKHGGRIDTIGIDENNSPVIIEYKRHKNQNIINQGLFYFDWLLDHKSNFEMLVMRKLGKEAAERVDWSSPRLLCIAGDFTKYDSYAVDQMDKNIELLRFQLYEDEHIMFELVNAVEGTSKITSDRNYKQFSEYLEDAGDEITNLFIELEEFIMSLGDDIQKKELKYYCAYKRIRNFACVEIRKSKVLVYLKVNPKSLDPMPDFARDVSNIGHYGTGDLEIQLENLSDLEKSKELIEKSYSES